MFGLPGGTEWILLVLIVLLLFGSARLPRLARSMREAREEFKKESEQTKGSAVPESHTENPEPAQTPAAPPEQSEGAKRDASNPPA